MILIHILGNSLPGTLFIILHFLIRRVSAIILPNQSMVSLSLDSLMFLVKHVRLKTQHPGYTHKRREEEYDLNESLTRVELRSLFDRSGRQEHVDQHVEQVGWTD